MVGEPSRDHAGYNVAEEIQVADSPTSSTGSRGGHGHDALAKLTDASGETGAGRQIMSGSELAQSGAASPSVVKRLPDDASFLGCEFSDCHGAHSLLTAVQRSVTSFIACSLSSHFSLLSMKTFKKIEGSLLDGAKEIRMEFRGNWIDPLPEGWS